MAKVFDDVARTDKRPGRYGESTFAFLNRSASTYFGVVRDLIEEWFANVPAEHQAQLRGGLRNDDAQFASSFWELYLHEAYRRSEFGIQIHPEVPSKETHPDFRLEGGGEHFYIEAVSVGRRAAHIAEDSRLQQVHRVLTEMRTRGFGLELSTYGVGPRPLSTQRLRTALQAWIRTLDPDDVSRRALASPAAGFARMPEYTWEDDGWSLVFHALPRGEWVRDEDLPALGVMGPGEATAVDNVTGIRRVLEKKRSRYGALDGPLVIAVLSNTEIPTRDYEFENALFGIGSYPPAQRVGNGHLFEEGLWVTTAAWHNAHVPQVIAASNLMPWSVARVQPRIWSTLEPGVIGPSQPDWLAPVEANGRPEPGDATPIASHFGLPEDWPAAGDPDFDPR